MNFEIGEVEKPDAIEDSFAVEIRVMYGDADGYETFEYGPFMRGSDEDTTKLAELLSVLKRMSEAFPHGRGSSDLYEVVEGFEQWFNEAATERWFFDWPYDVHRDTDASLDKYRVVYYDDNLQKHNVTIVKD